MWMNEIEKNCTTTVAMMLVGNKADLDSQRTVSAEEGQELADHYNIRFVETSAKNSKNVESAFTMMTRETKSKIIIGGEKVKKTVKIDKPNVKLNTGKPLTNSRGCC